VIRFLAVTVVLLGAAQAQIPSSCPELTQLQTDADASLTKADGLTGQNRCDALVHYSSAWADMETYARKHGELCGISTRLVEDIAESHKRAVSVRENACGGRRTSDVRPRRYYFPAEIRPRW